MRSLLGLLLAPVFVLGGVGASAQSAAPAADRSSEVLFFQQDKVAASFQTGGILAQAANYKVMTAKRDAPGEVEVHTKFMDVFYVVAGSATIVVGGKAVGQKSTDADEPRWTSIEGGEVRHLSEGDVVVIPAGVPHWINSVDPPFHYFVVKVAASAPQS